MKKIVCALLSTVLVLTGFVTSNAQSSEEVALQDVNSLEKISNEDVNQVLNQNRAFDSNLPYEIQIGSKNVKQKINMSAAYTNRELEFSPKMMKMNASPMQLQQQNENTSPGNSIYVAPNTGITGNILDISEVRWYITQLDEKSKLTTDLKFESSLDLDIYVYKFDQNTSSISLVNGSTNETGIEEKTDDIFEPGIYFIAIASKNGTGNFALSLYNSTLDLGYEINDTMDVATKISNEINLEAIIDNPKDIDIYKLELSDIEYSKIELISPASEKYSLLYYDGKAFYNMDNRLHNYNVGTHYFLVVSESGGYSQTKPYQLKRSVEAKGAFGLFDSPNQKYRVTIRQRDNKICINNVPIDFSYEYNTSYSNTGGKNFYVTTMKISEKEDMIIDRKNIEFGSFTTNWNGSKSHPCALRVTVSGIRGYMYRNSGGAYNDGNGSFINEHFDFAVLIIDPDTSRVIDIQMPNWYYMYGNQSCNFSPYSKF